VADCICILVPFDVLLWIGFQSFLVLNLTAQVIAWMNQANRRRDWAASQSGAE
jgi:hypothetical protein